MMRLLRGYPSTTMDDYQLNTINILKHSKRNFQEREITCRNNDGKILKTNYEDTFIRVSKMANALEELGIKKAIFSSYEALSHLSYALFLSLERLSNEHNLTDQAIGKGL